MDLKKHTRLIVGLSIFALIFFTVILGFGTTLGVDPAFREGVAWVGAAVWGLVTKIASEQFSKDKDGDGIPDPLDSDD